MISIIPSILTIEDSQQYLYFNEEFSNEKYEQISSMKRAPQRERSWNNRPIDRKEIKEKQQNIMSQFV